MLEISVAKLTLADRWMDSGGCKKLVCDCFLCLSIQARRADCEWTKHFMDVASDRGQNFYKEWAQKFTFHNKTNISWYKILVDAKCHVANFNSDYYNQFVKSTLFYVSTFPS